MHARRQFSASQRKRFLTSSHSPSRRPKSSAYTRPGPEARRSTWAPLLGGHGDASSDAISEAPASLIDDGTGFVDLVERGSASAARATEAASSLREGASSRRRQKGAHDGPHSPTHDGPRSAYWDEDEKPDGDFVSYVFAGESYQD